VFSTLPFLFDVLWPRPFRFVKENAVKLTLLAATFVIAVNQLVYNLNFDAEHYFAGLNKEKDSQAIQFYEKLDEVVFSKIPADDHLVIFRDVRMYVADLPRWEVKFRWGTQDYAAIQKADADVLILWKQRLYDYTQEGAAELALDQTEFAEAARFYKDALNENVKGYHLIYQNDYGVAYISTALYDQYFK
jgi:hypothetical protein